MGKWGDVIRWGMKKESRQRQNASKRERQAALSLLFFALLYLHENIISTYEREREMELSRGFVINTHQRQFWQAQIPYLSRRTLGKGLLSWCMGCTSESWSSPFSVLSGNRQSSPRIHLKGAGKQEGVETAKFLMKLSSYFCLYFFVYTEKKTIVTKSYQIIWCSSF